MLASSATGEPLCFTSSERELGDKTGRKTKCLVYTHVHAHVTVSKMILKPPYQGSVCVFGPTVLIPRTMKLYHSKHRLMEADSRPIYLRLLLV